MQDLPLKTLSRNCPICESDHGQVLHNQKFQLAERNFLPFSYDVVWCAKCGFIFADTSATQKEYDRYYRDLSKYESTKIASGSGVTEYDLNRLEQTAKAIVQFFPDKTSRILDVGCANGGLLSELKKFGYDNLSGLDPSPTCVDLVNKKGLHGKLGGIFTENNFNERFDGILLTHVLEHMYDVRRAVDILLSWLENGGKLYVEVPDAERYKDFFITPYYFFDVEHINHFDKDAFINLFKIYDGAILKVEQKDMTVSAENKYPAVYAVFQKFSDEVQTTFEPIMSSVAKESVLDHIAKSASASINPTFEKLVVDQEPVIVWGAGQATQRLLQNTNLGDANILFFVDNDENKYGSVIKGKKVISPNEIGQTNATICICSALHSKEILTQIKNMKISNPTIIIT